jgi:peptidyl-tRNA hydrolase
MEDFVRDKEKELVQYFLVNKNLVMSTGKIIAQVSHACMLIALRDQNEDSFKKWMRNGITKVVLEANEDEIINLHENLQNTILIVDKGYTEIPISSKTVLGFPIMTREIAKQYVGKFNLFKEYNT